MADPLEAAYGDAVAAHKRVAAAKRAYEAAAATRTAALKGPGRDGLREQMRAAILAVLKAAPVRSFAQDETNATKAAAAVDDLVQAHLDRAQVREQVAAATHDADAAMNRALNAAVARVRALCDEADLFSIRGIHPNRVRAALGAPTDGA